MKRLSILALGAFCSLAALASAASIDRMKPLKVSENGHFLVEEEGKPFFILADTAWPLFSGLSREDVEYYLDDRKARGFNTILCTLLDSSPTGQAPRHRVYGFWAFDGNHYDSNRPNKQYWNHVDWVIRQARRRSLRLAIVPFQLATSPVGWADQLTRTAETHFGEYLGIRTCNY
ncbi:MAG: apiosidase-like domain-containing protein, partial [Planctomycetota bacterium]